MVRSRTPNGGGPGTIPGQDLAPTCCNQDLGQSNNKNQYLRNIHTKFKKTNKNRRKKLGCPLCARPDVAFQAELGRICLPIGHLLFDDVIHLLPLPK